MDGDDFAERRLRDHLQQLETLIEAMPDPVFFKDREGIYRGCNAVFAQRILGIPKERILGRSLFELPELIPAELAQRYHEADEALLEQPGTQVYEAPVRCSDGERRWFCFHKATYLDSRGEVGGIVGLMVDVTEARRSREELERAREVAETASRAKTEFLATMSHELRTPLCCILTSADLLVGALEAPEHLEGLDTIRACGNALLGLIDDMLEYAELEAGRSVTMPVSFAPLGLAAEVVAALGPAAVSKGLSLAVGSGGEEALARPILADRERLRRLLLALVGNAVKFTERGAVTLTVRLVQEGGTTLLESVVSDTGPGFADEDRARLFAAFTQGDGSPRRRHGGVGLGLALAGRLAQVLGGTLAARSETGRGSEFTVRVPVATAAAAVGEAQPRLVALIDEDPVTRFIGARFLEKAGFAALVGGTVAEVAASEVAPERRLVAALVTCRSPESDGREAVAALRAWAAGVRSWPGGARLPVVALLAEGVSTERPACRAVGFDGVLSAPLSLGALVVELERVLGRPGGSEAEGPALPPAPRAC